MRVPKSLIVKEDDDIGTVSDSESDSDTDNDDNHQTNNGIVSVNAIR